MKTLDQRFWEKVRKQDGCWEWTGAKTSQNRPYFSFLSKPVEAIYLIRGRKTWRHITEALVHDDEIISL